MCLGALRGEHSPKVARRANIPPESRPKRGREEPGCPSGLRGHAGPTGVRACRRTSGKRGRHRRRCRSPPPPVGRHLLHLSAPDRGTPDGCGRVVSSKFKLVQAKYPAVDCESLTPTRGATQQSVGVKKKGKKVGGKMAFSGIPNKGQQKQKCSLTKGSKSRSG